MAHVSQCTGLVEIRLTYECTAACSTASEADAKDALLMLRADVVQEGFALETRVLVKMMTVPTAAEMRGCFMGWGVFARASHTGLP